MLPARETRDPAFNFRLRLLIAVQPPCTSLGSLPSEPTRFNEFIILTNFTMDTNWSLHYDRLILEGLDPEVCTALIDIFKKGIYIYVNQVVSGNYHSYNRYSQV